MNRRTKACKEGHSGNGRPLVVLAGSYAPIFDCVENALEGKICDIVRYDREDTFIADPAALDQATVFLGYGILPVGRNRLGRASRLRAIISPYTGTEGFDIEAASEYGVIVSNGQVDENYIGMAEATILMILAGLYDLKGRERAFRNWVGVAGPMSSHMLSGKTVGLFGFGRIARAVVERLSAWGVRFIAHTRHPPDYPGVSFVSLDDLLVQSDVLCVLVPFNESTKNMLNADRLRRTKPGSVLVVISRGGIVDEDAVFALAREGHFLRVAMDVFAEEPYPQDRPLRELEDAILTPHSVGHSLELVDRLPTAAAEAVLDVLAGKVPERVLNPDIVQDWAARWGKEAAGGRLSHG